MRKTLLFICCSCFVTLLAFGQSPSDTAQLIRIPVVFNVIHLGEPLGQGTNVPDYVIIENLKHLNDIYRRNYEPYGQSRLFDTESTKGLDTKVEFYLADVDSNCLFTSGIRRFNGSSFPNYTQIGMTYNAGSNVPSNEGVIKKATQLYPARYLNIWLVNKIYNPTISVNGFANLGTMASESSGYGIVLIYDNFIATLPHEMGHIFGLDHPDMAIGGFTNRTSFDIVRKQANILKKRLISTPLTCNPGKANDLAVLGTKNMDKTVCKKTLRPLVKLKNYGNQVLKSCILTIAGGGKNYEQTWTGQLSPMDTLWVALPPLSGLNAGQYRFKITASKPNGQDDQNKINDTLSRAVTLAEPIKALPYSTPFEANQGLPIYLTRQQKSEAYFSTTMGLDGSGALVLSGDTKAVPDDDFVIKEGDYFGFEPYYFKNNQYFANADFCIATVPNKHYKVKYYRHHESFGNSLRVLANGIQVKPAVQRNIMEDWSLDSAIVSSYADSSIVVSFHSSCESSGESDPFKNFVVLDNLSITETPKTNFVLDFTTMRTRVCLPTNEFGYLTNHSKGVPVPELYTIVLTKNNVPFDTVRKMDINEIVLYTQDSIPADYGAIVKAKMHDGSIVEKNFPAIVTTKNWMLKTGAIQEGFEGTNVFEITSNTSNHDIYWKPVGLGAYQKSNQSIMTNYVGMTNSFGDMHIALQHGPFDFSEDTKVSIRFDRAYASCFESIAADEFLTVEYSLNCGQNWERLYTKYGNELKTADYNVDYMETLFVPTATQWASEQVNLNQLVGKKNVLLRLAYYPQPFGNSLYLDNIQINNQNATGLQEQRATPAGLLLYPNPAHHSIDFAKHLKVKTWKIMNEMGTVVLTGVGNETISLLGLPSAMYICVVEEESGLSRNFKFIKVE